jgi:hypothetical protein
MPKSGITEHRHFALGKSEVRSPDDIIVHTESLGSDLDKSGSQSTLAS